MTSPADTEAASAPRPSAPSNADDTVVLVSKSNEEFKISLKAAKLSETLAQLIQAQEEQDEDAQVEDSTARIVRFDKFSSPVLKSVIEYMDHRLTHEAVADIPPFKFPDEIAIELYVASEFLKI